jgi:hypothetical protein
LIKTVAHLTNNKDVFLCILRYHCRRGLVQQYEQMLEDMLDDSESRPIAMDQAKIEQALNGDRNFSISCELGVRYPTLKAMLNHEDLHLRMAVSVFHILVIFYSCYISVILLSYQCHTPVLYMSYSCRIYVILLSYICHTPVVYMSYSCRIYVILLSYICHTPVVCLSYSCRIYVILLSYSYLILVCP